MRATWNTPATTIVAAWMSAETGVGPSIASGNQMCKGNMALLPAPPMNISTKAVGRMKAPAAAALAALPIINDVPWVGSTFTSKNEKLNERV